MGTVKKVLIPVVLVAVGGWWLSFGTLSPCESMRGEIRRIAEARGGMVAGMAAEKVATWATRAYTPLQCARKAIDLKLRSEEALKDLATESLPDSLRD